MYGHIHIQTLGNSYILLCYDYYLKTGENYQFIKYFAGYGERKLKGRKRS